MVGSQQCRHITKAASMAFLSTWLRPDSSIEPHPRPPRAVQTLVSRKSNTQLSSRPSEAIWPSAEPGSSFLCQWIYCSHTSSWAPDRLTARARLVVRGDVGGGGPANLPHEQVGQGSPLPSDHRQTRTNAAAVPAKRGSRGYIHPRLRSKWTIGSRATRPRNDAEKDERRWQFQEAWKDPPHPLSAARQPASRASLSLQNQRSPRPV